MLRRRHLSLPPLAPPPWRRGPRWVPQATKNSQILKFLINNMFGQKLLHLQREKNNNYTKTQGGALGC